MGNREGGGNTVGDENLAIQHTQDVEGSPVEQYNNDQAAPGRLCPVQDLCKDNVSQAPYAFGVLSNIAVRVVHILPAAKDMLVKKPLPAVEYREGIPVVESHPSFS